MNTSDRAEGWIRFGDWVPEERERKELLTPVFLSYVVTLSIRQLPRWESLGL